MVTLADRVIEYFHKPERMLHPLITKHHSNVRPPSQAFIERMRTARKYVLDQGAFQKIESLKTDNFKTFENRLSVSLPTTEGTWIEYNRDVGGEIGIIREGIFVYHSVRQNTIVTSTFADGVGLGHEHDHPIMSGVSFVWDRNNRRSNFEDDVFYRMQNCPLTIDEVRAAFSIITPIADVAFIKPMVEDPSCPMQLKRSLIDFYLSGHEDRMNDLIRIINILSVINTIPLSHKTLETGAPFRLKGKAQKIQRLRGIQEVSLSLEKGWTVKRYLKKAVKEHNSNTGITQGEHSVREHDRVYYRGTDKEYTVKIGSYRKGSGLLKTERRFIVTE